jgi:thiol-disulfide isomerase/thioredoxin
MIRRVVVLAASVGAALVLVAGCGRPSGAVPSHGTCLAAASGGWVAPGSPAPGSPAPGGALPDLALACLDGGGPARLARLGVPAVVNLWATWCGPCRQELPAFQRFAERAGDRVRVVGVVTRDEADSARAFATELGLRFPVLLDPDGELMRAVGVSALPATVFVDAAGRVSYLYNAAPLDAAGLERLAEAHLGVVVRTG